MAILVMLLQAKRSHALVIASEAWQSHKDKYFFLRLPHSPWSFATTNHLARLSHHFAPRNDNSTREFAMLLLVACCDINHTTLLNARI